jgi:two-component system chemotaxis response regulator CheB
VQKPTALEIDQLLGFRDEVVEKVKRLAETRVRAIEPSRPVLKPGYVAPPVAHIKAVVIGISTGGPQALRYLIPQLPADFPVPIAIVLHMPVGYTEMFAAKLDEIAALEVLEAKPGLEVRPGRVILAQAGRHLAFSKDYDGTVRTQFDHGHSDKLHRPAADVMFRSAAEIYGTGLLGIVMTGMGDDGKEGAAWIKAKGGVVLTEAEESCVIYGMPRSVVEAGLSDAAIPLKQMAEEILQRL